MQTNSIEIQFKSRYTRRVDDYNNKNNSYYYYPLDNALITPPVIKNSIVKAEKTVS